MLLRLFIAAMWSPAGKWLTSWLLFVMFNRVFVTFPCGILGHMYYLIVSIPELCRLSLTFILAAYDISSPKVTYTYYTFNFCFLFMKTSMGGWLVANWIKLLFFCKNRLQSIYTSIVNCVYNLKTHAFFLVICGVSFIIPAMCIVYICSVLTSAQHITS